MAHGADSSDSDAGGRRFRRTGPLGNAKGSTAGAKKTRRGKKSVEAAIRYALEFHGGSSSEDERKDTAQRTKEFEAKDVANRGQKKRRAAPSVPLSEVGAGGKSKDTQHSVLSSSTASPSTGNVALTPTPQKARVAAVGGRADISQGLKHVSASPAGTPKPPRSSAPHQSPAHSVAQAVDVSRTEVATAGVEQQSNSNENSAELANLSLKDICQTLEKHNGKIRKGDLLELTRSKVTVDKKSKNDKSESPDGISPDAEARFRALEGQKKRAQAMESESEGEDDDEQKESWKKCLEARCDGGVAKIFEDFRTAFSMKECTAQEIRKLRLNPANYLGNCSVDGQMLYDDQGKVNLHFLLPTYRFVRLKRSAEKDKEVEVIGKKERSYLKFLIKQARELRLVSMMEMKRGRIQTKRVEKAKRNGRFSLALAENLAEGSEDEAEEEGEYGRRSVAEHIDFGSPKFRASQPDADTRRSEQLAEKAKLRELVSSRQSNILTSTSHDVDLKDIQDKLLAPSFSFDWEDRDEDKDDLLEVEIPEEIQSGGLGQKPIELPKGVERKSTKRNLFRDQLRRAVSFEHAKQLAPMKRQNTPKELEKKPSSASVASATGSVDMAMQRKDSAETQSTTDSMDKNIEDPPHDTDLSTSRLAQRLFGKTSTETEVESSLGTSAMNEIDLLLSDPVGDPTKEDSNANHPKGLGEPTAKDYTIQPEKDVQVTEGCGDEAGTKTCDEEEFGEGILTEKKQIDAEVDGMPMDVPDEMPDVLPPEDAAAACSDVAQDSFELTESWLEDISPTAMWGRGLRADAGVTRGSSASDMPNHVADPLENVPRSLDEISPTVPFVAQAVSRSSSNQGTHASEADQLGAAPQSQDAGISPTMPFLAHELPQPTSHAGDISPTMPFEPQKLPQPTSDVGEISPTLPFAPALPDASRSDAPRVANDEALVDCGAPNLEGSKPFVSAQGDAHVRDTSHDVSANFVANRFESAGVESGSNNASEDPQLTLGAPRKLKRSASAATLGATPDAPESDGEDMLADDFFDTDADNAVPLSDTDKRRLQQERLWLKHKRLVERKQNIAQQKNLDAARATRVAKEAELGKALMSKEEIKRFEVVVSGGGLEKKSSRQSTRVEEAGGDEAAFFTGHQRGIQRKKSAIFGSKLPGL